MEQEGTYPLPEAQLDRFLLYIKVDYPSGAEEWEIARRVTGGQLGKIKPLVSGETSSTFRTWSPACRSATRCWATPGPWCGPRGPARPRPPTSFIAGWPGAPARAAC